MKKTITITICILSVFLLSCSNGSYYNMQENDYGSVVSNGGIALRQGDWFYFRGADHGGGIYKSRTDGSEKTQLITYSKGDIWLVGGYIYYLSQASSNNTEGSICKISVDGGEPTQISVDDSYSLVVTDEFIYYNNRSDFDSLYKMRLDGSDRERLVDEECWEIQLHDDKLYYVSGADDERLLCRMNLDGSNQEKIGDAEGTGFVISGDKIFYKYKIESGVFDYTIWKMELGGGYADKIVEEEIDYFNVSGEWIYYISSYESGRNLCKMKTDGSEKTILFAEECGWKIDVVDDWVFFETDVSIGSRGSMFRIKTDGSERTNAE